MNRLLLDSILLIALMTVPASLVDAGVIVNGDFSIPVTGGPPFDAWETDATLGDPPDGGVGQAVFEVEGTPTDPLTDAQQLQQPFAFMGGSTLSSEYMLETMGTRIPTGTPDAFNATLLDSSGAPLFSSTGPFYSVDNTGDEFFNAARVLSSDLGGGLRRVNLNLSSLPSQDLTIFFYLTADPLGRHDGLVTTVSLDNVAIGQHVIPEPSTLAIMSMCVAGAVMRRRRRG